MKRLLASTSAVLLLSALGGTTFASFDVSDLDGDGLTNLQEDVNNNSKVDSGETDPLQADSDHGGESDGSEVKAGRNPLDASDDFSADPDGDSLPNGLELLRGTNPKASDSDGDGVNDATDPFPLEKAFTKDSDHDGMPDEWELQHGFQPSNPADATLDADSDGVDNRNEFVTDTDPRSPDTDRDGLTDGEEVTSGTDPAESLCLSYSGSGAALFTDIAGHFAESGITALSAVRLVATQQPIIGGYNGDQGRIFLPNRPVTRLEFLKMALLSSCISLKEASLGQLLGFTDMADPLPETTDTDLLLRYRLVQTATDNGIVRGYEDGTFRPDAPVGRAEAVRMLLKASRLDALNAGSGSQVFSDVTPGEWFMDDVAKAAALGIVQGYGDGTFRPGAPITRAEAALIILRAVRANPSVNGEVLPPG